jgi:hypothetical protein
LKKNYIGIVSDKTEELRAVESLPKSDRLAKESLVNLMAAVLHRDIGAGHCRAPGKANGYCLILPVRIPVVVERSLVSGLPAAPDRRFSSTAGTGGKIMIWVKGAGAIPPMRFQCSRITGLANELCHPIAPAAAD